MTDRQPPPSTQALPTAIVLICRDPVTRVLASRMVQTLGLGAPVLRETLDAAALKSCKFLLIDEGDLPEDDLAWPAAGGTTVIVMSTHDRPLPAPNALRLRKPLDLPSLKAALQPADSRTTGAEADDVDAALWNELLTVFGRAGVAEMIAALQRDLPPQQQRLETASRAEDDKAIRSLAHSLRGVALQFGAASLAEAWDRVEHPTPDAVLAPQAAEAAQLLQRHEALIRRVQEKLHDA